jgi:TetR/AcrR family transcriptional repressor of nem operon
MARPIEFDRDEALHNAMRLFWRRGYQKTSMRDLTEATRLQPGSLYAAFHNKRSLFLKSLDYYSEDLRRSVDHILRSDNEPLERIRIFFNQILDELAHDSQGKGCMLVNTLLESPVEEQEITNRAAEALGYVESRFVAVLDEAKLCGDLSQEVDVEIQAKLLMTAIFGLRVYARMHKPPRELRAITESMLAMLDPDASCRGSVVNQRTK